MDADELNAAFYLAAWRQLRWRPADVDSLPPYLRRWFASRLAQ